MHKKEILKLQGLMTQKGYTLVPLQVYFKGPRLKVEIGLCRGKKLYDKRDQGRIRPRDRAPHEGQNLPQLTHDPFSTFAPTSSLLPLTFYLKYGGVPVSTGIVKCDKRAGPGNPVKMPNLKN